MPSIAQLCLSIGRKTGYAKTGYVAGAKPGFYEKVIWPPMALRIGLPRNSALQNDGFDAPVILQRRPLLRAIGGQNIFHKLLVVASSM